MNFIRSSRCRCLVGCDSLLENLPGTKKEESRWRIRYCGGNKMIDPERAKESQVAGSRNRAVVCSIPPSDVGMGSVDSLLDSEEPVEHGVEGIFSDNGRK